MGLMHLTFGLTEMGNMAFKHFHIENKAGKAFIKIIGSISFWRNDSASFTQIVDELINSGIEDADVYINCFGGSVYEANEIINQLKRFTGVIKMTIGAISASAGFTLILPFKPENTYCHRNSQGMYHEIAGSMNISRMEDFDSSKKQYQDLRDNVVELLSERMGLSKEDVDQNMRNTTWLNSKELVKYNIVAKGNIIDLDDRTPSGAKNELKNLGVDMPTLFNQVEEYELEDILNPTNPTNQNSNNNETEMKEIAKKLGLPENANADQIANAIEALQNRAKYGEEALVNLCVTKGIKKENAEKSVTNNFDGTLELVNGIETPAPTNDGGDDDDEGSDGKEPKNTKTPTNARPSGILEALKNELGLEGGGKPKNKKKWDDYSQSELDELEKNDPAKFEQLFNDSEVGQAQNVKF